MMLENYATAKLWARRMASADGIGFDAITALRFGDAAAAYAASDPQYGNAAAHGWAALLLGHKNEAAAIARRIEKMNATGGYATPLFLALVAESDGDTVKARQWIARAADEQRRDFGAELIPLIPASEQLGALELRGGNRTAAHNAFEETLALYPNDPRATAELRAFEP
jgi:hypothetical protein